MVTLLAYEQHVTACVNGGLADFVALPVLWGLTSCRELLLNGV